MPPDELELLEELDLPPDELELLEELDLPPDELELLEELDLPPEELEPDDELEPLDEELLELLLDEPDEDPEELDELLDEPLACTTAALLDPDDPLQALSSAMNPTVQVDSKNRFNTGCTPRADGASFVSMVARSL